MSYAPAYAASTDFSDFQNLNPTTPLPGTNVDVEFTNIGLSINALNANLQALQQTNGQLKRVVGLDQLKTEVSIGINTPTNWLTATLYESSDCVIYLGDIYRCLVTHTSGTFATDLAAQKWELLITIGGIAQPYLDDTLVAKEAAEDAAFDAAISETNATEAASRWFGFALNSVTIGTGAKVFTTQSDKFFLPNNYVYISSAANINNNMYGQVLGYVGTTLTVNVERINGSGTFGDWIIQLTGPPGQKGDAGSPGAGTGDMLAANNGSEFTNKNTFRTNVGLGSGNDVTHNSLVLNALTNQIIFDGDGTYTGTQSMESLSASRVWTFPNKTGVVGLTSDIATAQAAAVATANAYTDAAVAIIASLFTGYIQGIVPSNGVDTANDISFTAGGCISDDGTTFITMPALIKQTDVAWASGTNAGCWDSGTLADGETAHFFAISKNGGVDPDIVASNSATAPTLPGSYTKKRRIFSVVKTAGSLKQFNAIEVSGGGIRTYLKTPTTDVNGTSVSTTPQNLVMASIPLGLNVLVGGMFGVSGSNLAAARIDETTSTLGTPTGAICTLRNNVASVSVSTHFEGLMVSTLGRLRVTCSSALAVYVTPTNYVDARR